ncbi:MAG TPA: hypothetical protein P5294_05920 [Smithellaceae bacterium]|nr:hypothetical protein [Smithellaceae bacterium]HRS89986.1 hypothetical protein [Smithellaceae bacterium]HRV26053.1 hypothetical protein [Smithellaceae bacterium]
MKNIFRSNLVLIIVLSVMVINGCAAANCVRWETRYRTESKKECTSWERTPYNRCLMYRYYTVEVPYSVCVEQRKN